MSLKEVKEKIVEVKRSPTGLGLFMSVPVKKGRTIIEYVGERISALEGDRRNNRYIFNVSSRIDIDGSPRSNDARYINHSCRPNCEAINRGGRVFIVARRGIKAGEELHYDYGKNYFAWIAAEGGCRCEKCSVK
jgi:SET domain-containing protein